jgi:hypothetical protein
MNIQNQKGFTLYELVFCIVFILGVVGWILNFIELIELVGDEITTEFIIRCIGLIPPIGAVLGYIPF